MYIALLLLLWKVIIIMENKYFLKGQNTFKGQKIDVFSNIENLRRQNKIFKDSLNKIFKLLEANS